jgi:hypothetical protein
VEQQEEPVLKISIARWDSLVLEEPEATVVLLHDVSAASVVSSGRVIPTMEEGGLVSLSLKIKLLGASPLPE